MTQEAAAWCLRSLRLIAFASGCGVQSDPAVGADASGAVTIPPPLTLPSEGATVRVTQRTTAALPGSGGALQIALGDITGGQVNLTLGKTDGSAALVSRSVREGEQVAFVLERFDYTLVIEELHDSLMGIDWAQLRVRSASDATAPAPAGMDGTARIEALLSKLERSGVTFIRNGSEHDAREAALHLRNKWSRAPGIDTPERFIDELATRSSQSGAPYRVRLPDGTEHDAGPWLHALIDDG